MGNYGQLTGTSVAAPHVTGVAALIHALFPGSSYVSVRNRILVGGTPLAQPFVISGKQVSAHGALTCGNSSLLARMQPAGSALMLRPGIPIKLAVMHLNCAGANGAVNVTVASTGQTIELRDDGTGADAVAGDGMYSASWSGSDGTHVLNFPGGDSVTVTVDRDLQSNFPVRALEGSGGRYQPGPINYNLVAELQQPAFRVVIANAYAGDYLYAWRSDGTVSPGWPLHGSENFYPAAGELSTAIPGNEIAIIGSITPALRAIDAYMGTLPGWPQNGAFDFTRPPTLADLDGDGLDEIIFGQRDGALHVYRDNGTILAGWPAPGSVGGLERNTPAVADLDGDGSLDIVSVSSLDGSGNVGVYVNRASGALLSGFPVTVAGFPYTFPVIGDVDADGRPDIVVVGRAAGVATAVVIGVNGVVTRSIALSGTVTEGTAPALADLDNDGIPEIVVQTHSSLNVVRGTGATFPGWPVVWGSEFRAGNSAPVVGDIDGDQLPEIVVATQSGTSRTGLLRAYRRDGTAHPRFPKALPIGPGTVPAIADIDRDGRNEVIVTSGTNEGGLSYVPQDKLWVFDLGGGTHSVPLWSQFMRDARHTGAYPLAAVPPPPLLHLHRSAIRSA